MKLLNSLTLDLTDFVSKPQTSFRQVMLSCKINEQIMNGQCLGVRQMRVRVLILLKLGGLFQWDLAVQCAEFYHLHL